MDTAEEVTA